MSDEAAREAMADLLGALAHPDRLHIVQVLAGGPHDVASISTAIGCSQPRTSQRLALLKSHQLLTSHREGRRNVYELGTALLPAWIAAGLPLLGQPVREGRALAEAIAELRGRLALAEE